MFSLETDTYLLVRHCVDMTGLRSDTENKRLLEVSVLFFQLASARSHSRSAAHEAQVKVK